ncbi:MAG: GAF and ANTAR domain-containing protein [Acidimicrobiales bacterium]
MSGAAADDGPDGAALGPEQRAGDRTESVSGPTAAAAGSGAGPSSPLRAGNGVIDAALRLVTTLAHVTVAGSDGVSVSLSRHGELVTVAASDETIAQMDRDQYATGEGPCLAAAAEGHWFHVESVAEEHRWPEFTRRALQVGIGSILSTPLMGSSGPVGALNVYSTTERAFGPDDQSLAALFATEASAILAEAAVDADPDAVSRLHRALQGRELIAQAQGVLMARAGCTPEVASSVLRQSSKRAGMPVRQRAGEIVDSALRHDPIQEVGA